MHKTWRLAFIFLVFMGSNAEATLVIPSGLTGHDRGTALAILGYGSAVKLVDNPYPLGGYSGLEVGLSTEIIDTSQIAKLGNGAPTQSQTSYDVLSVGKGFYDNIDVFFQFGFLGQAEQITNFGGQLRWGFFEAKSLPIFASLVVHGNSANFNNQIDTNSFGVDLVGGVTEGDATVYVGVGTLRSMGVFTGGSAATGGITDTSITERNGIEDNRFLGGLNVKIAKEAFVAGEIDSYTQPAYSAKLGLRF